MTPKRPSHLSEVGRSGNAGSAFPREINYNSDQLGLCYEDITSFEDS